MLFEGFKTFRTNEKERRNGTNAGRKNGEMGVFE